MPSLIFCALVQHDRGWENETSLGRIGRNIFCQCGVKGHRIKKIYKKKLITRNSLIVDLMDSVL